MTSFWLCVDFDEIAISSIAKGNSSVDDDSTVAEDSNKIGQNELEMDKIAVQVELMPEYVVVCGWRSIKEVSLLLGQLTNSLPVVDPEFTAADKSLEFKSGLITVEQVNDWTWSFQTFDFLAS